MNFDTVLLAATTDELSKTILGSHVDKVSQPEPDQLIFSVYSDNRRSRLLISTEADSARIHLSRQRSRPNPLNAPAFCMLLRKHLDRSVIEAISQPQGFSERVLKLTFNTPARERTHLWVEIMGRQSNVIFTMDSGLILGSIKRVTHSMSRFREIKPGIAYAPPPKQLGHKRDPTEPLSAFGLPEEIFADEAAAEAWLITTFRGVGSLFAREAVARSSRPLSGSTVWYGMNDILSQIRLNNFAPVLYRDTRGQIVGAYPLILKSLPIELQSPVSSLSEAVEAAFSAKIHEEVLETARTSLLAALRKAAKTNDRQILDTREGLVNSEQSQHLRENGELLLANISGIQQGVPEVIVQDYFADQSLRTIKLDTALSPHENAERYFRRFQKARDSVDILERRLLELTEKSNELAAGLQQAMMAESVEELLRISGQVGARQQQPVGSGNAAAKPLYDGHKIKSIKSPDGWEILVGENSTSNDYLTTKVASPSDIWLHARAVPSAHAVIRSQNRPASVSNAAIMLAAEQVAQRSQAKHAGLVSIDYTLKKYVRKPRGSAPGKVTYTNEKTVDVIATDDN